MLKQKIKNKTKTSKKKPTPKPNKQKTQTTKKITLSVFTLRGPRLKDLRLSHV